MLCRGIDSGTTICKALVLDVESDKVLAQAASAHEFIAGLPHGAVEQDPRTWLNAAEMAISDCLQKIPKRRQTLWLSA